MADSGELVEGYAAFGGDTSTCGLTVAALSADDVGEWACSVNEGEPGVPFHRGTFQILTDGFLGDVRYVPYNKFFRQKNIEHVLFQESM